MAEQVAMDRLLGAERQGLKLAIFCRTIAVCIGFVWLTGAWSASGFTPNPMALVALALFALLGFVSYAVIGTRYDRWWLKYALYAVDILGLSSVFLIIPVSQSAPDLPQVLAFRTFGIHYFFPIIAMACLTLSWRLVAWSGIVSAMGWLLAFGIAIAGMEHRVSWRDLAPDGSAEDYYSVFFSPDFVGYGSRVEEVGFLLIATAILALAVVRARRVFLAQQRAEAEREAAIRTFGRFVPETIAERLATDKDVLAPQVRRGVVLDIDIEDFTAYAQGRDPKEVIRVLGAFLARAADAISSHEGVVISFTGDGLLAAFNTPLEIRRPERAALDAATGLLECADAFGFDIRIGLAAGPVATGRVGSERRQAFTIYGDTVNRAARLQALAKDVGAPVLVDAEVAGKADPTDRLRPLGEHHIRGFEEPVSVWAKEWVALPGIAAD